MQRVLFVCLGNICRSPTAEGVFRHLVTEAGCEDAFFIDSAGTGGWHVGEAADRRMRKAAKGRGIALTSRSRQVRQEDFEDFDFIYAMDRDNLRDLKEICPPKHKQKLVLLRDYDTSRSDPDVPDPYYGGPEGFDTVLDIVDRCCRRLLEDLQEG